jgi:hypothetical protein
VVVPAAVVRWLAERPLVFALHPDKWQGWARVRRWQGLRLLHLLRGLWLRRMLCLLCLLRLRSAQRKSPMSLGR